MTDNESWNAFSEDPYLPHMAPKNVPRKAPEIHLGYFTRVRGLTGMLLKSIEAIKQSEMEPIQIVNLGAGFDTLYWRLKVSTECRTFTNILTKKFSNLFILQDILPGENQVGNFIEVDFPTVTARKCHLIKKSRVLLDKIVAQDRTSGVV